MNPAWRVESRLGCGGLRATRPLAQKRRRRMVRVGKEVAPPPRNVVIATTSRLLKGIRRRTVRCAGDRGAARVTAEWLETGAVRSGDGRVGCGWCLSAADYMAYHDDEWGRPVVDNVQLYEKLCLEGFQSGLS